MIKKIQILKTPGCSSCARALKLIAKIKEEAKLTFSIEELDLIEHPELVQKYQILTSPGIIIDGTLAFAGMPSEKKLKEKLMG